jgi:iron complex outermembrane receptor protein
VCAGLALPATAQEADRRIEEVVVTAQKRTESLQSVPISIKAFSEEDLRTRRIDSLGSLANRTAGFAIGEFFPTQPQIYIRGIGSNDDGPAADPSTVVFIDEVYVGRSAGWTSNLFDLERVEVLRGPQGTLYGKNVVGGAINLISRKPDENFRAQISASAGNYDHRGFKGLLSGPLAENLYGKISVTSTSRDGYLDSQVGNYPGFFPSKDPLTLGKFDQLDKNTEGVRASLRWLPTDALEVNLSVDNATLDQNAPGFHRVGADAADVQMLRGLIPGYADDPRVNMQDRPARTENETTGVTVHVDYDLGWSAFTSITAYRESDTLNTDCCASFNDEEASLLASSPTAPVGGRMLMGTGNATLEDANQFSQELRLTSQSDGPFEWVAGLYYLREQADRSESFNLGLDFSDGAGGRNVVFPTSTGVGNQDGETESIAAYGQATWHVTDKLRLTAGTRWTKDSKTLTTNNQAGGLLFRETFQVQRSDNWSAVTPKFSVDYQLTDDLFVYALASKGFKSGGFQGTPPTRFNATTPFEEETAWLYETGVKSEWLEGRAQVNVSAFYTDYTDLQVFQLLTPVGATGGAAVLVAQNAADAEVQGIETEFTLLPLPGWTISGSYSYLDATYSEFFAPSGFVAPNNADLSLREGNRLRNAPEHSGTVMSAYEMVFDGGRRLTFQLDWRYQGKAYQGPDNQEIPALPAYDLLDARISLGSRDGAMEFALWAENLLDEDYYIHGYLSGNGGTMTPGLPRLFGATVTWSL